VSAAEFLRRQATGFGARIDAEAAARIVRFLDLLTTWNRQLHLTGERDPDVLLRRHALDSLACVPFLPEKGSVLDLGTGAGFPGIILACARPDLDIILLDSRRRPISFLSEAVRTLGLEHAKPRLERAELAAADKRIAGRQRLVTSRAMRIGQFLELAAPLLSPDGVAVSMQTPRTSAEESAIDADRARLALVRTSDYELAPGEWRRLVICRPK
jgi:16S rRNA (guanine527-N7)-methyltransferase